MPDVPLPGIYVRSTATAGDQLRIVPDFELLAYGRACAEAGAKAEREECTKLCDAQEESAYAMYRGDAPILPESGLTPGHSYLEGMGDGAGSCADAIRARSKTT